MTRTVGDELAALSERVAAVAARMNETSFSDPLTALLDSAERAAVAWSGSVARLSRAGVPRQYRAAPAWSAFQQRMGIPRDVPGHNRGLAGVFT